MYFRDKLAYVVCKVICVSGGGNMRLKLTSLAPDGFFVPLCSVGLCSHLSSLPDTVLFRLSKMDAGWMIFLLSFLINACLERLLMSTVLVLYLIAAALSDHSKCRI